MNLFSPLLLLIPRVAFRSAVINCLAASALAKDATGIWQRTLALQAELRPQRPQHSPGVNHFLRFMEWDLALYRALREYGLPHDQASRLIEEINWKMFGAGTKNVFAVSRLRSARLQTRIQWILDLMFAVLFTKPFRKQPVASGDGIAFDVTSCPVAAYFQQQGQAELTGAAACNLDHRMAQIWGIKLERTRTIAEGHSYCDFRFRFPTIEKARER